MLEAFIRTYIEKFQRASLASDYRLSQRLLDEMRERLRLHPPQQSEIVSHLQTICDDQGQDSSATFVFIAAWANLSPDYCEPLCNILDSERCKAWHEQVAELLYEIGDARAVATLRKAIDYRWEYDQGLEVPKKALQTLARIKTPEAVEAIREASRSSDDEVRKEAWGLLK